MHETQKHYQAYILPKDTVNSLQSYVTVSIASVCTSACVGGSGDASSDSCSLPITSRSLGSSQHYSGYDDWRLNDNFLDWHGAEAGQGLHLGQPAYGSPSAWTTNVPGSEGYQALNT